MAASYTVTPTPRQQAVLDWITAKVNAEQKDTLTVADFIQLQFAQLLSPFDLRFSEWEADEVKKRFAAADDATRASVKTALGI